MAVDFFDVTTTYVSLHISVKGKRADNKEYSISFQKSVEK